MIEPKPPAFEDVAASQAYWLDRLHENRGRAELTFLSAGLYIMIGLVVLGAFLGSILTLAWHG